jgi:hypothetical protein
MLYTTGLSITGHPAVLESKEQQFTNPCSIPLPSESRKMSPVFLTLARPIWMQWPDLHQHFPGYSRATDGEPSIIITGVCLGWCLDMPCLRFEAFVEHVLKPLLEYDDFWWRFEWQLRVATSWIWLFKLPLLDENCSYDKRTNYRPFMHSTEVNMPDAMYPAAVQQFTARMSVPRIVVQWRNNPANNLFQ